MNLGPMEILVILVVALLIFGPKNLPKLGTALGQTVHNVREGMEEDPNENKAVSEATTTKKEEASSDEDANKE